MDSDSIYADLDGFISEAARSSKKYQEDDCGSINSNSTEMPVDSWMDKSDILTLCSTHYNESYESTLHNHANCTSLQESELKKAEMELFAELVQAELEEKKEKLNHEADYENLRQEIERFKQSESEKDAKISELTMQVTNLKKNICSLYKTAKSEIAMKDNLLHEANKKLDRLMYEKSKQTAQVEREPSHLSVAPNLKENSCPKNSTSHKDKINDIQHKESHRRAASERNSSSRRDYRTHRKTSSSGANSTYKATDHKNNSEKNAQTRRESKHEYREKRKDRNFLHKSSTQPLHSHGDNYSIQNKERKLKCDIQTKYGRRTSGDGKEGCRSSRDSRHKFGEQKEDVSFQKGTTKSSRSHVNIASLKKQTVESKCEIQKKSCEKNGSVPDVSRKRSSSAHDICKVDASVQTNGTFRDLTETNSIFFNMLPDALKHSFTEYEQKQIITLNKLKQSFVNYYIESQNERKRLQTSLESPCDFTAGISGNTFSESYPTSFLNPLDFESSSGFLKNILTCNSGSLKQSRNLISGNEYVLGAGSSVSKVAENQTVCLNTVSETKKRPIAKTKKQTVITKSERLEITNDDIIKLYRYQNSKVPFLVKRRFGLLNNSNRN